LTAAGNTCYLNSSVQCLSHIFPLVKYFVTGAYEKHVNTLSKDSTKGVFANEFGELMICL
jgi:ubiquitin C-terminal hydrolase